MSDPQTVGTYADLAHQVVVVTGAASGIGAATVRALLANSVRVVAVDINAPKLASRANEWRDKATAVVRDAADVEDVAGVVALCEERFGRLDGFVANAAITRAGNAVNMTPATWDEVMAINLRSVYLAAHFAIPAFRRAGGGSLVVVASQVGLVGYPDNVAYCAAKGGLINLTKALALDHAAEGIRVNNVCPGPIETEMLLEGFAQSGETRELAIGRVPMGRLGDPAEIASAVVFLLSSASAFTTGSSLVADGGYTAR
jgi:NAD(P)-dependent dehydrogenase (short-subunit alcohol dehydrogenase family)